MGNFYLRMYKPPFFPACPRKKTTSLSKIKWSLGVSQLPNDISLSILCYSLFREMFVNKITLLFD